MESPSTAMEAAAAETHSAPCIGLGGDEGQGEHADDSSPEYPYLARNASVHCAPSCLGAPMANAMLFWLSEGVKVNVSAATVAGTVHLTVDT